MVNLVAVLPTTLEETLSVAVALSRPLLEHLHCLVVTLGPDGVLLCGEHIEAGSVNLQPRKLKKVSMYSCKLMLIVLLALTMWYFSVPAFVEKAALCSSLPSTAYDPRGDNKCVRSRR